MLRTIRDSLFDNDQSDARDDQQAADKSLRRQRFAEEYAPDNDGEQWCYERDHHRLGRFDSTQEPIVKPKCGDGTGDG